MIIVDGTRISVERLGTAARLIVVSVVGIEVRLTLPDLEQLAAEFTQAARAWRSSLTPNFYQVLNVPKTATMTEIKKAYRALAKQFHPDHGHGDEQRLKSINAAYEVLRDPERRREYDQRS